MASLFKHKQRHKVSIIKLLTEVTYEEIMNAFLNVLSSAIKKRVMIPTSSKLLRHRYLMTPCKDWIDSVHCNENRSDLLSKQWLKQQDKRHEASIGLLYSGGIDSQILAALCDRFVPAEEPIDLINVVCGDEPMSSPDRLTAINGLLELKQCINPNRKWRLIKVNLSYKEIVSAKQHVLSLTYPCCTIMDFNIGNILWFGSRAIGSVRGEKTEYQWIENRELVRYAHIDLELKRKYDEKVQSMDIEQIVGKQLEIEFNESSKKDESQQNNDSANNTKEAMKKKKRSIQKQKRKRAKELKQKILDEIKTDIYGEQQALNENESKCNDTDDDLYISAARVLLLGFGSDELLGGYGRHRTSFRMKGENGLKTELNKDFNRLWKRNLGRDDRLISDHSREARWPFLDKQFISFIKQLPLKYVCDLNQPLGIGDKKLLRDCARKIGLKYSWSLVKRAIQFGSRIANNKVAGYVNITDNLNINDLINYQIYGQQNQATTQDNDNEAHTVNAAVTKKYNRQNGKAGFQ